MAHNVKAPLAACLLCAAALALLVVFAIDFDAGRHLDWRLFLGLAEHRQPGERGPADLVANLGDPLPLLGLVTAACVVALLRRRPADALAAVAVVIGANLTTQLLKALLAHPRVRVALGASPFEESTFPSGHTTAAASIAVAWAFVAPAGWRQLVLALGAGLALAVGCAVIVIGWHYPSDVLAAFLVVAGWGFGVLAARRALAHRGRSAGVSPRAALPTP